MLRYPARGERRAYPDTLISVKSNRERQGFIHSREPMVIIASSGMLTAGVSPAYAKPLVQDEQNLLAFVGYQDEGAPGKRFLELTETGGEVQLPTGPKGKVMSLGSKHFRMSQTKKSADVPFGGVGRRTPEGHVSRAA